MNRHISIVALGVGLAGCQLLLATDRAQCATDADCTAKAGAGFVCRGQVCEVASASPRDASAADALDTSSPWACLASPPARVAEDRSVALTIRQRFVVYSLSDCQQNRPVPGAELRLCSQRDVTCGSPVETAFTDCDGYVTFKAAYRGFEGYAVLTPPAPVAVDGGAPKWPAGVTQCFKDLAAKEAAEGRSGDRCAVKLEANGEPVVPLPDDFVPGILSIVPPPAVSADPNLVIPEALAPHLFSSGTLRSLLGVVGKPFDPKAGHLSGLTVDCQRKSTPGVAISVAGAIGPNSQVYYTDSQALPNVNQGETAERGETGYLNLEPGPSGINVVSVTATRQATGERIGVYAALIRSGYITYLEMPPLKN